MRIGIDARELGGRATGVGRYLGGLLREWAHDGSAAAHEFVLYAHAPLDARVDAAGFTTRVIPGRGGTWWEQTALPRAAAGDRLDVFFAPAYSAPLSLDVPTVVAIHDVSFFAHPEWFGFREGMRRRLVTGRSAVRAAAVVTISEFSRDELIERVGVPSAKIHVVPPGVEANSLQPPASSPTVLFVGSIFNRRHVPALIRAFGELGRRHAAASLDIVGDNRSHPREDIGRAIAAEGMNGRIRWHAYASDADLHALYEGARAFAFLSEYEGLGLTPLEALAAGAVPVLLDTPVARESCGDAALYVQLGDIAGTTRALELALFDEPTRARILSAAAGVLARYDWPTAARQTLGVLEGAA